MRRQALFALLAPVLAVAACQGGETRDELAVERAWVRLAAVPGRPAAAYFSLRGGAAADRLAAIESPQAARAELHEGGMHEGMMTMRPMNGLDLPAGRAIAFAPGGDHVMLFGVDPAVKPGGTLALTFRFVSGAERRVDAEVVGAGDPEPAS